MTTKNATHEELEQVTFARIKLQAVGLDVVTAGKLGQSVPKITHESIIATLNKDAANSEYLALVAAAPVMYRTLSAIGVLTQRFGESCSLFLQETASTRQGDAAAKEYALLFVAEALKTVDLIQRQSAEAQLLALYDIEDIQKMILAEEATINARGNK